MLVSCGHLCTFLAMLEVAPLEQNNLGNKRESNSAEHGVIENLFLMHARHG